MARQHGILRALAAGSMPSAATTILAIITGRK